MCSTKLFVWQCPGTEDMYFVLVSIGLEDKETDTRGLDSRFGMLMPGMIAVAWASRNVSLFRSSFGSCTPRRFYVEQLVLKCYLITLNRIDVLKSAIKSIFRILRTYNIDQKPRVCLTTSAAELKVSLKIPHRKIPKIVLHSRIPDSTTRNQSQTRTRSLFQSSC
jgi:hypothetical protein